MEKKQIVNIINFIRGFDPRTDDDLTLPVRKQIELLKKHRLKGTFLVQYDALCNPEFTDLLKALDPEQFEIGAWFEVVEPLTENSGIEWRGRYPWDWHSHCAFSVGYTEAERERLADTYFNDFKKIFGYYPKSFGSWAFDAHTLDYISKTYGIDAACNCKDQWGTDGYTLWGGYYGQGYYPSRNNAFTPAQTPESQIGVPVFRMLGSDPVSQYDLGLDSSLASGVEVQGVVTLEPVYTGSAGGGGVKDWVDWYLAENFSGRCLTFGYAQAGQENSFGWEAMRDGLEYQFQKLSEMESAGEIEALTMRETGIWFKSEFETTPPAVIAAVDDWKKSGKKSVWYCCKNYRINLYAENGRFWIRDLYIFREDYRERYLGDICTSNEMVYDNLPVFDGNRFSGGGIRGGLYPFSVEKAENGMRFGDMIYSEDGMLARVNFTDTECGDVTFILSEEGAEIQKNGGNPLFFEYRFNRTAQGLPGMDADGNRILYKYRGMNYKIKLDGGTADSSFIILCESDRLKISFE